MRISGIDITSNEGRTSLWSSRHFLSRKFYRSTTYWFETSHNPAIQWLRLESVVARSSNPQYLGNTPALVSDLSIPSRRGTQRA